MKRFTCSLAFLILTCVSAFAQEKQLTGLLKAYGIPGMQLVCIKGDKIQNFNLGVISKGSDKKVTSNTVFEAASLSKCVFSYIVMRLYDRGTIDLDRPLMDYVGSYD